MGMGPGNHWGTPRVPAHVLKAPCRVDPEVVPKKEWTTVMLQRIPESLDRVAVMRVLDDMGYRGRYDACHVPRRSSKKISLGYAFVNFLSPEDAADCISNCSGRPFGGLSDRQCVVAYSHEQGAPHMRLLASMRSQKRRRLRTGR